MYDPGKKIKANIIEIFGPYLSYKIPAGKANHKPTLMQVPKKLI